MKVTISENILDYSVSDLMAEFGVTEADQVLIKDFGSVVLRNLDHVIDEFYVTLRKADYFEQFFPTEEDVQRVARFHRNYWTDFFTADISEKYIDERARIGKAHARINLPLKTYLVGFNLFGNIYANLLANEAAFSGTALQIMSAMNKRIHLDASIVASTYAVMMNEIVVNRSNELEEEVAQRLQAEAELTRQMEDVEKMNKELSYFNKIATDRELKMIELKKEINELLVRLGEDTRYTTV